MARLPEPKLNIPRYIFRGILSDTTDYEDYGHSRRLQLENQLIRIINNASVAYLPLQEYLFSPCSLWLCLPSAALAAVLHFSWLTAQKPLQFCQQKKNIADINILNCQLPDDSPNLKAPF